MLGVLVLLASYLYISNKNTFSISENTATSNVQTLVTPSSAKHTGIGVTQESMVNKLQTAKIGVTFHPEINKYFDKPTNEVLSGEVGKIMVSLIGSKENLTQISYSGELSDNKDSNNNTLTKMYQLTDAVDPEITKWFIATSLEFDKTILSGTKRENIINGRNVEISYTYDNSAKAFSAPGYIFVIITGSGR